MTGFWLFMQGVVTVFTVAAYWLTGNKTALGWLFTIAANAIWVVYAVGTGQYLLLIGCILLTLVCFRNWFLWKKDTK